MEKLLCLRRLMEKLLCLRQLMEKFLCLKASLSKTAYGKVSLSNGGGRTRCTLMKDRNVLKMRDLLKKPTGKDKPLHPTKYLLK